MKKYSYLFAAWGGLAGVAGYNACHQLMKGSATAGWLWVFVVVVALFNSARCAYMNKCK